MRDLPQLKRIREERALSQRDLAAMSGVAHDSIGQIERGERQARPSTVRKLAEALGVEPLALLADWESYKAAKERVRAAEESVRAAEESYRESLRAAREGASMRVEDAEQLHAQAQQSFKQAIEHNRQVQSAIAEYEPDIARARSKMGSGDPQDVLEITELAKRNVYIMAAWLSEFSDGFEHFADWYHMGGRDLAEVNADPDKTRVKAAAEAALAWLDFYNECLDWLDQEITVRRKEATSLEDYVKRLSQSQDRDLGESSRGENPTHTWRSN
jgi:transcriptional regulator with XRE-family HTH domain